MKYVRMCGLLGVAVAAVMAFAGSASATTLTSPTGTTFTGKIHAVGENGHVELHTALGSVECDSTAEAEFKTHGAGVTVRGPVTSLLFYDCTNEDTVTVKRAGTLEVHWTSGYNGTLTSNETEVEVYFHSFGGSCIYLTKNTDIGTVTGGTEATLDIDGDILRTGGSLGIFCDSFGVLTGSYKVTTPHTLYVDK
jgi:hypothetical protein